MSLSYSLPLPPAAATLTEGLSIAVRLYVQGKLGWFVLIGTIAHQGERMSGNPGVHST